MWDQPMGCVGFRQALGDKSLELNMDGEYLSDLIRWDASQILNTHIHVAHADKDKHWISAKVIPCYNTVVQMRGPWLHYA